MSDAALKDALRELREDLERLRADLKNTIAELVSIDEHAEDDILAKRDDGSIVVDVVKALLESLDDAAEGAADAFKEFDEEVDRVWRRFKQALLHSQPEKEKEQIEARERGLGLPEGGL
jgi:hypothetical protein